MPLNDPRKEGDPFEPVEPKTVPEFFPNRNDFLNLEGFIRTLSEDPSSSGLIPKPRNLSEQIVLVKSGGSTAAYIYDTVNQAWKYVALT